MLTATLAAQLQLQRAQQQLPWTQARVRALLRMRRLASLLLQQQLV